MIRRSDLLWIASKKLLVRKRWVLFTVFSLSLGLVIFTASVGLIEGIRAAALTALDQASRSFYADLTVEPKQERPRSSRPSGSVVALIHNASQTGQRLSADDEKKLERVDGVDAVWSETQVEPVKLGLPLETYHSMDRLTAAPESLIRRIAAPNVPWPARGVVPLVMSRAHLRSQFDETAKRFKVRPDFSDARYLGRTIDLWIGFNQSQNRDFRYDYSEGQPGFRRTTEKERDDEQVSSYRNWRSRFDLNIFRRALRLKAQIVGLSDLKVLVPLPFARDARRWIALRNRLAQKARGQPSGGESSGDAVSKLLVAVREPAAIPAVVGRIEKLGYRVHSRQSLIQEEIDKAATAFKTVKAIFYGIGLTIFALSCLLVWTTTSKVVADSRREIGVFRAVGATRRDILSIFILQATLLGTAGALLGVLLGVGLAAGISTAVLRWASQQRLDPDDAIPATLWSVDLTTTLLIVAGAILASVLAGLIPARRAARMDPVTALTQRE